MAEAVVVRPKPVVSSGFGAIWVRPHCQWLISLGTSEVVPHNIDIDNAAIELHIVSDENGDVVMARKRPFSFQPQGPVAIDGHSDFGAAYKFFDVQVMKRVDGSEFLFRFERQDGQQPRLSVRVLDVQWPGQGS